MQVTHHSADDSRPARNYYHGMTSPPGSRSVTLGLVQMHCTPDPEQNMQRVIQGIREAAGRGAQIVCLQELFRSQYFGQTKDHGCFRLAEPIPGPSTATLGK